MTGLVHCEHLPVPKKSKSSLWNCLEWAVETNYRNDQIPKEGNPTAFPLAFLLPQTFVERSHRSICPGLFQLVTSPPPSFR